MTVVACSSSRDHCQNERPTLRTHHIRQGSPVHPSFLFLSSFSPVSNFSFPLSLSLSHTHTHTHTQTHTHKHTDVLVVPRPGCSGLRFSEETTRKLNQTKTNNKQKY